MIYTVFVSEKAEQDLEEIYEYIQNQSSRERAGQIIGAMREIFTNLTEFPERGNIPKEFFELGVTLYREAHFKPYRILYRIVNNTVRVTGVFDGRRDMVTLLEQRLLR